MATIASLFPSEGSSDKVVPTSLQTLAAGTACKDNLAPNSLSWDLENAVDQLCLLPHQDLRETWGWINPTPEIPPLWTQVCQPCPQLLSSISPLSSPTPATELITTSEQRAQLLLWTFSSHTGPCPSKQSVQQALDRASRFGWTGWVPFTLVAKPAVMKGQIPGQAEAKNPPASVTATSWGVWPGPKYQFWSTLGLAHAPGKFSEHG